MTNRITLLVFFLVCVCLNAQQQTPGSSWDGSQNPNSRTQNPNSTDCSDFPNTAECASRTLGLTPGQNSQSEKYSAQPVTPFDGSYSDVKQAFSPVPGKNQIAEPRFPPQPLTEFQKFVATTIGQVLPVFGANLFQRVPSTFAPLDMTPVPSDFVIGPGDELRIRIWGQLTFQANVRVDRSGNIYLPQIGSVHVASIRFAELDGHLRNAIGRVFHDFDLSVDLGQIRSIQVYIAGAARVPGLYTISSLSTLTDALFAAGGPAMQGSLRDIQLRRGRQTITHFDLYDLLVRGYNSEDAKLFSGDVIFIPPIGSQVAISGSVKNPGIYELLPGETLASTLASAGGASSIASAARVSIERIEEHRHRHVMEVSYDKEGVVTTLADGDIIRVLSIVPHYENTVVLRGNLANPGRFSWHPGMRVSELIPDKDSLITRDYWWKRTQLGLPALEFEPSDGFQDLRQPENANAVNLKRRSNDDDAQDSIDSQQNRNSLGQQWSTGSSLGAQQSSAPSRGPQPQQRTTIRTLAPDIDWDYAAVERIDPDTLKTSLFPFDLGKLVLHHDSSQDMELKSGDIVSIFSQADIHVPLSEQTKFVTLDGEFVHSGVYSVRPDETLRELVERAGGITPKAYLYGSEFTRQSVRVAQQSRIDEYVQTLETRIHRSNLALAASASTTAQDIASGASAQNSERDLLAGLRQIRATGRVVLTLKPDSAGTVELPQITMENGDRFVIPAVPSVVTVIGAVYNQNSFLYVHGQTAGAYLLQAGGPNKDADQRHEFVIRANGDVVSRDAAKSAWRNEFANLRLHPGDTIVVPEKTFKPSALRGVIDWSQVFSQFALGAAAINVIK
jgi:protein involved in polysaccharide export with SLBB domain